MINQNLLIEEINTMLEEDISKADIKHILSQKHKIRSYDIEVIFYMLEGNTNHRMAEGWRNRQ